MLYVLHTVHIHSCYKPLSIIMVIKNPRLSQLTLSKYLYIKFLFKEKLSGKKIYIQKWDGEKNQRYVSCKITPPPFFSNTFQEIKN